MERFVKVPVKRYIELENSENELMYLNDCGVDNWHPNMVYHSMKYMNLNLFYSKMIEDSKPKSKLSYL